jgi:hypothetical protein
MFPFTVTGKLTTTKCIFSNRYGDFGGLNLLLKFTLKLIFQISLRSNLEVMLQINNHEDQSTEFYLHQLNIFFNVPQTSFNPRLSECSATVGHLIKLLGKGQKNSEISTCKQKKILVISPVFSSS